MRKVKIFTLACGMLSVFFILNAGAQFTVEDKTRESNKEVKTREIGSRSKEKDARIVVTGTRTRKLYSKAPVKTEVVSRETMEVKNASTLFDALNGENGVMADNMCQNCGLNTIRINGLEGNYTQFLVNSSPAVSNLVSTYFAQQFPVELIDRVEIVKGGGSALYGAGAIGGVVNVITRKPNTNQANFSYKHEFIDGNVPADYINGFASAVSNSGNMGIAVYGSRQTRDEWDENDDKVSDLAKLKNTSFGVNSFYSLKPGMDLSLNYLGIQEYRRGGDYVNRPASSVFVAEEVDSNTNMLIAKLDHEVSKKLNYVLNYSYSYMERKTYYGGRSDLSDNDQLRESMNEYGLSKNPYQLASLMVNYLPLKGHTISLGLEYKHDKLWDGTSIDEIAATDETYTNMGGFLQYNFENKLLDIVAGVRVDKHSELDDVVFSPRLNGVINLSKQLRFRAGVTTGFVAPQVFDEDFHIEISTSAGDSKQRRIKNVDDLKKERSITYTGDFNGDFKVGMFDLDFGIGAFYTEIRDKMEVNVDLENPDEETATTKTFYRDNVSGTSKILGYNLTLGLAAKYAKLQSGVTYIQLSKLGSDNDVGTKDMIEVPKLSGFTMFSFLYKGLVLTASNQIIGEQKMVNPDGELVTTDTFLVFNTRVAYKYFTGKYSYVEIFAGIDNITNAYQDDLDRLDISNGVTVSGEREAGYVYGPGKPRTYYLGCKAGF